MKISSKVRNGLASMIYISKNYKQKGSNISLLTISSSLNISKIYLEQAFVLLKKENLVTSSKGPKGGYTLSKPPHEITVYDILFALDNTIFEKTEKTIDGDEKNIEQIMQKDIFSVIDQTLVSTLSKITLEELSEKLLAEDVDAIMYYV